MDPLIKSQPAASPWLSVPDFCGSIAVMKPRLPKSVRLEHRPDYTPDQLQQIVEGIGIPVDRADARTAFMRKLKQARQQFLSDLQLQETPSLSERTNRIEATRSAAMRLLGHIGAPSQRDVDVDTLAGLPKMLLVDLGLGQAEIDRETPDAVPIPVGHLSSLIVALQDHVRICGGALIAIGREENPGRGGDALDAFIDRLIDLYEEFSGKNAGLSRQPLKGSEPGGPFFRYLTMCIDPLFSTPSPNPDRLIPVEPEPPSNEALGTRLRRRLTKRRGKST